MPSLRTEDTVFLFTQPVLGQGFSQGEFSVDLLHHGDFLPCAFYSTAENENSVWFLLLFVLVGLSGETEPIGYIYTCLDTVRDRLPLRRLRSPVTCPLPAGGPESQGAGPVQTRRPEDRGS